MPLAVLPSEGAPRKLGTPSVDLLSCKVDLLPVQPQTYRIAASPGLIHIGVINVSFEHSAHEAGPRKLDGWMSAERQAGFCSLPPARRSSDGGGMSLAAIFSTVIEAGVAFSLPMARSMHGCEPRPLATKPAPHVEKARTSVSAVLERSCAGCR